MLQLVQKMQQFESVNRDGANRAIDCDDDPGELNAGNVNGQIWEGRITLTINSGTGH